MAPLGVVLVGTATRSVLTFFEVIIYTPVLESTSRVEVSSYGQMKYFVLEHHVRFNFPIVPGEVRVRFASRTRALCYREGRAHYPAGSVV